jgi:ribokinase
MNPRSSSSDETLRNVRGGDQDLKPIVVLGSLNLDLITHVEKIPVTGETLFSSGYEESLGGKGANQAVGTARLGAPVSMIGRVGEDAHGKKLLLGLTQASVDASAVLAVAGNSGTAVILHATDGANAIIVHSGANAALRAEDVRKHAALIEQASILLLQLETPIESVTLAANIAHANGVSVMLDPAPAQSLPRELMSCVTWLTPNETEADTLLQNDAPPQSHQIRAHRLLELGVRNVVLKLGGSGAYLAGADCIEELTPAFHVDAVDTTAAGDCFNAAFASRLVLGDTPSKAALYANAAAALCVGRHGAQAAMPAANEVDAFLSRLGL